MNPDRQVKYYYIEDKTKQQAGPFDLQQLKTRGICFETMVWRPGMADWQQAGTIDELSFLFVSGTQPQSAIGETQPHPISRPQEQQNQFDKTGQNEIVPMPKNWLIEAIVLTLICCSPVSAIGIYYALKVETRYSARDYENSAKASNHARNWSFLGMLFLPACYILYVIFAFFASVTGGSN